jgi:NTP pyrophosphatase (non-canonical NTP hydrolase)
MGASSSKTGLSQAEPSSTVSALTGFDPSRKDFLTHLREVNKARLRAWEGDNECADALFHAAELGGEVGELLNVVKKLHRESMGWRGSRATMPELEDEIGDVLICLDKLAAYFAINLSVATAAKFNKTSDKVGLPHKLVHPHWLCGACGAAQNATSTHCAPPFTIAPHRFDGSHPADQIKTAIAIEARRAATGNTDAVEDESAASEAGDAQ